MTENSLLWQRLADFSFDEPGVSLPFSRRLARENGWSHSHALLAIDEYRRFVFLTMVAGHPCTPSDEVDQVWHLHLCYTRSYWEDMCGEVLGRPLHHGPTRGGRSEGRKFDDWYSKTLASYERHFDEQPPAQFWPTPVERFARRDWRRLDVSDTLLVSRRALKRHAVAAATLAGLLTVAGCRSLIGDNIGVLIAVLAIGGVGFLLWHLYRSGGGGGGGGSGDSSLMGGGTGTGCGGGTTHHDDGGSDGGGGDSGCGGGGCGGGCGGCGG